MKTILPKVNEIQDNWFVIDAQDQVLGRLATLIATRLRGKHRPDFTPHLDTGDFIVVVNAEKIKLTGNKVDDKLYYKHTGYLGHLKTFTARTMLEKKPEYIIQQAVKRMLPKNRMGVNLLKKLKIYAGPAHPHQAQLPQTIQLN
jgi:large subunit ribosomal protein L13